MPIGLFTNPLQMIFSLLLMQGISLTMFRAFLNQAISRNDPMRFSLNLGNTNNASGASNSVNGVPTPTPIVDPRVLDLLTLIKALTPATTGQSTGAVASAPPVTQVATAAQVMSAPLILASASQTSQQPQIFAQPVIAQTAPLVQHAAPSSQMPQIIIIPSLKTSPSEPIAVKVPPNSQLHKEEEENISVERNDDLTTKLNSNTSNKKNVSLANKNYSDKRRRLLESSTNKQNGVIIFETVGVNFRHPNHNYDKVEDKEEQVLEIDASHS